VTVKLAYDSDGEIMPTMQDARRWLERWDRQQENYIADREERFAVVADVVTGPCSVSIR